MKPHKSRTFRPSFTPSFPQFSHHALMAQNVCHIGGAHENNVQISGGARQQLKHRLCTLLSLQHADDRQENSARSMNTSKTVKNMPLPQSTASAALCRHQESWATIPRIRVHLHVETGKIQKHPLTQNIHPLSNLALREQSAHPFTVHTESGTESASGSEVHLHVENVRKTVQKSSETDAICTHNEPSVSNTEAYHHLPENPEFLYSSADRMTAGYKGS